MVSKILIISLAIYMANAATWFSDLPPKPKELAHKEGCYIEEINDVVPFGAEVTPIGHCYRVICERNILDYASCGVVSAGSKNCHVTGTDLRKPYPECCPDVKCDSENVVDKSS